MKYKKRGREVKLMIIDQPEQDVEQCVTCGDIFPVEETICCQGENEHYPLIECDYGIDVDNDAEPVYIAQDLKTRCEECYMAYQDECEEDFWKENQPELYSKIIDQYHNYKEGLKNG